MNVGARIKPNILQS